MRAPSAAPRRRPRRGSRAGAAERQRGLAPAEQVAASPRPPPAIAASAGGSDSQVSSSVRDATRRPFQSRGGRYVDGQSFGSSPASTSSAAPLVGLAPQERRRPRRCRRARRGRAACPGSMWSSAGRRRQLRRPDLGGVADREGPRPRPARLGRRRGRSSGSSVVALEPGEVAGEPLGQPVRRAPESTADRRPRRRTRQQELRRGQQDGALDRARRALVGRVEGAQRVDLVAEELDPDRQLHRRREDVDDAAPPRELAATGDLGDRRVAEVEQVAQERVLVEPGADQELARLGGQVVRRDRVLEQRLDARDEDPRAPAAPGRQRGDARRRLVGDELAPLVGERGPRLEDGDRRRVARARPAAPRRPGRRSRRRGRSRRAARLERRAPPRGTTSRRAGRRRRPACRPTRPTSAGVPSRSRSAANEPVAASSGGSADRSGSRWPATRSARCGCGGAAASSSGGRVARSWLRPPGVLDLGVDRRDVEVDGVRRRPGGAWRAANSVGDLLGDAPVAAAPAAQRSAGRRLRHRAAASRQDAPPAGLASGGRRAASGGPSTSPGAASRSASASRSWNVLKRLAALLVPSRAQASTRVGGRVEQLVEALAARRARTSTGRGRGRCAPGRRCRPGSRLNFSVPSSSMIERRPLWPPWLPASRKRSLPNGSAKSSATIEQVAQRRVLAGEHLADGEPGLVHVGQRLDEGQVEPAVPAARRRSRRRAAAHGRPSRPARRAGRAPASRRCDASRRTAHPGSRDRRRPSPIPPDSTTDHGPESRPTGRAAVTARSREGRRGWYRGTGYAVGPAAPSSRRSSARIARSSSAVGVVPAADVERAVGHEQAQLVGGRPADVAGLAAAARLGLLARPLDGDDDVAEVRAGGRAAEADGRGAASAARVRRNASGGSNGNDSTSVGPVLPMCVGVEPGELGVVGEDQPDRGRRRRAGRLERRGRSRGERRRRRRASRTPSRTSTSIRHGGR